MDFSNHHIRNIISILYQCKLIARKDIHTFCPIRRNIGHQIRREGETNNINNIVFILPNTETDKETGKTGCTELWGGCSYCTETDTKTDSLWVLC